MVRSDKSWSKSLSDVEFAINNTIHKSTGKTPSELLFGINQRGVVVDKLKEYLESEENKPNRERDAIRKEAQANIVKSQEYNKKYFDKSRKAPHVYDQGDYVMVKNFDSTVGVSRKLIPRYRGPYEIIKKLRNNRYVVADVKGFQGSQKPYQGVWEPANMRPWRS